MLSNKYISVLFSSGGASAITFFSYPLLALLYPLDSFGTFGVLSAYALICSTLIAFRFDYFILSTQQKATKVRYLVTGLLCCCMFFTPAFIAGAIGGILYGSWNLILMACLTICTAANNIFVFYLLSTEHVSVVNIGKFIRASSIVGCQFGCYYLIGLEFGLVVGQVLGMLFTFTYLFFVAKTDVFLQIKKFKSRRFFYKNLFYKSIVDNKFHIKFQLPQAGLNSVVNNAFPIFIEILFGAKVAGALFLVERFIKMPIGIIIDAARPLMISDLSTSSSIVAYEKAKLYTHSILALSSIFILTGFLFDPNTISVEIEIYNEISMLVLPVLAMSFSMLSTVPMFCFLNAHNKSELMLKCEVSRAFFIFLLVFLSYFLETLNVVLFYYVCSILMFCVPYIYFRVAGEFK